jgi:hypothetical protein
MKVSAGEDRKILAASAADVGRCLEMDHTCDSVEMHWVGLPCRSIWFKDWSQNAIASFAVFKQ